MKAPIYNITPEKVGDLTLPKAFSVEKSDKLVTQAIRVYLNNQRRAKAKTLTRGHVHGTTKKMWAQKGTGNARHGSAKAPIFVGGGIALGPVGEQNFKLKMPKKQARLAINTLLTRFAKNKKIIIIDKFSSLLPKTKDAFVFLAKLGELEKDLSKSKKIAIITKNSQANIKHAFSNLPGLSVFNLNSLNIYNLSRVNYLIISQTAINEIK